MKNKEVITFLFLLVAASAYCYTPMIVQHSIRSGNGTTWLMWCPGFAGLATCLIFHRNLHGFGWLPGNYKWLLLAYVIPIGYALAAYSVIWLTGLGGFPDQVFLKHLHDRNPQTSLTITVAEYLLDLMVVSFIPDLAKALGEEIGWRGFLVPKLFKTMSYTRVSIMVGVIWAVWHYPAILCTDYNIGSPAWFAIPCFTILVIEASFIATWLRLRSKSLWPCVIFHASHNDIIQGFLTPMTVDKGYTKFFIDEFGIGLVITASFAAWLCWKHQGSLGARKSTFNLDAQPELTP
jgi:uncharacterized protein